MSTTSASSLTGYLRQVLRSWQHNSRSDVELLTDFIQSRDERAFTTLVGRYGLLVWKVCRRTLRGQQDAEDAFQATFLVLAKKAAQIGDKERVGPWLYGVARRTAWDLRKSVLRRRRYEQQVLDMPSIACPEERDDAELLAILDEQIEHLPKHYREALVLCRLGGKTYAEAAQELGCSVITIRRRLDHAEAFLRERLSRRGLALSSGVVAAALSQPAEASAMPAWLSVETVRASLAFVNDTLAPGRPLWLAQGVLHSMGSGKTMLMWCVFLAALLGLGGAGLGFVEQPQAQAAAAALTSPGVPDEPEGRRLDQCGDPLPEGALARIGTLRFRPDRWGYWGVAAFLPDGKTLVTVHQTNTVHFWDLASGKERRRLRVPGAKEFGRMSVSPDGSLLMVGGQSEVQVWNLASEQPVHCWTKKAQGKFSGVAFSPDGKTIACSDTDHWERKLYLLDANTGQQQQTLETARASNKLEEMYEHLALSPNGKFLAQLIWGRGREQIVSLWEVATGKRLHTINQVLVSFIGFSPDSRTLATRTLDGIALWDVVTGKEKRRIPTAFHRFAPVFLPDGTLLEADGVRLRFWNPDTGKQCRPQREGLDIALGLSDVQVLSPDGKLLAAVSSNMIRVWQLETGKAVGPEGLLSHVQEIAFSSDGESVATLSGEVFIGWFNNGKIQLWQAHTGAPCPRRKLAPSQLPSSFEHFSGMHCTRDHRLYTFRWSWMDKKSRSDLVGWDTRTGEVLDLPPDLRQVVEHPWNHLAVSPNSQFLAVNHREHIALYELATGKEVHRLQVPPKASMHRPVFSADGRFLASHDRFCRAGPFLIWDVKTGALRLSLRQNREFAGIRCFALSPDGHWLALVENHSEWSPRSGVQLWEVASGKAGPFLQANNEPIHSVAFSPDGRTLAAGCQDGSVLLWDASSAQQRHAFHGHRGPILKLAFSPDGQRLASCSEDTTALVWDLRFLHPPARIGRAGTEDFLDVPRRLRAPAADRGTYQPAQATDLGPTQPLPTGSSPTDLMVQGEVKKVLERLGTPEAQQALEELARLYEGCPVAEQIQAALHGLAQK